MKFKAEVGADEAREDARSPKIRHPPRRPSGAPPLPSPRVFESRRPDEIVAGTTPSLVSPRRPRDEEEPLITLNGSSSSRGCPISSNDDGDSFEKSDSLDEAHRREHNLTELAANTAGDETKEIEVSLFGY